MLGDEDLAAVLAAGPALVQGHVSRLCCPELVPQVLRCHRPAGKEEKREDGKWQEEAELCGSARGGEGCGRAAMVAVALEVAVMAVALIVALAVTVAVAV